MQAGRRQEATGSAACREACPVCDGRVVERRGKLVCERCHAIVETCCDGGKQGA
jgi:hypothetical protein